MRIARMCAPAPGGPAAFALVLQYVLLLIQKTPDTVGPVFATVRCASLCLLALAGGAVLVLIDRWFGRAGTTAVAT
jgi:hypothetical protein